MTKKILYTPLEVNSLIEQDAVLLIDIRDSEAYTESHIPGAVNVPEVFTFLSTSTPEGLAELQAVFGESFSRTGVNNARKIIFYEDSLDSRYGASCRGYWLAGYLGHQDCGILDGGFFAWQKFELREETTVNQPTPSSFTAQPDSKLMATRYEVVKMIDDPSVILLDNRDAAEWLGQSSSPYGVDFAPRRGRIPGAKWIEWYSFMDRKPIPAFKPVEEIIALCASQNIYPDTNIIIYCFKGSRAAHTYVALKLAGFQKLRVYFASWNEWARDPLLPVECGEAQNPIPCGNGE